MQRLAFVDGAYRTPPGSSSWLGRAFPWLMFYPRLMWIIWQGGRLAQRGRYGDDQWIASSRAIVRALEHVGCQFEIEGVEHLERLEGPCVVVANHMSTLETAVLPAVIHPVRKVTFVVKSALLRYHVFGHLLRSRDPIGVDQKNPRDDLKKVLVEGAERIGRGLSVVVFPEGARRAVFDPVDFNTLGVKLAQRAGVPLVPLAIDARAWAIGKRIPDIGRIDPSHQVRFCFGKPMLIAGRGMAEQQATIDFIRGKLAAWQTPMTAPLALPAAGLVAD